MVKMCPLVTSASHLVRNSVSLLYNGDNTTYLTLPGIVPGLKKKLNNVIIIILLNTLYICVVSLNICNIYFN